MKKVAPVLTGLFILAQFIPSLATAQTISSKSVHAAPPGTPLYLYIPSLKLYTSIQGVGTDSKGRMDVPSGRTNNVGWYEYGVTPGSSGTAVLDAHNTAAFKTLNKLPVGADIYVYNSNGRWLKFTVMKEETYLAATTPSSVLFEPANRSVQKLNLITCAGELLGNGEATHRLIVSAQLSA